MGVEEIIFCFLKEKPLKWKDGRVCLDIANIAGMFSLSFQELASSLQDWSFSRERGISKFLPLAP